MSLKTSFRSGRHSEISLINPALLHKILSETYLSSPHMLWENICHVWTAGIALLWRNTIYHDISTISKHVYTSQWLIVWISGIVVRGTRMVVDASTIQQLPLPWRNRNRLHVKASFYTFLLQRPFPIYKTFQFSLSHFSSTFSWNICVT